MWIKDDYMAHIKNHFIYFLFIVSGVDPFESVDKTALTLSSRNFKHVFQIQIQKKMS